MPSDPYEKEAVPLYHMKRHPQEVTMDLSPDGVWVHVVDHRAALQAAHRAGEEAMRERAADSVARAIVVWDVGDLLSVDGKEGETMERPKRIRAVIARRIRALPLLGGSDE